MILPTEYELVRQHIDDYESISRQWLNRSNMIVDRYNDVRSGANVGLARFNILWSNIQTLLPACYAKPPKPCIQRRFKDDDEKGLVSSDVLERATDYFTTADIFHRTCRSVVLDRLLVGRGISWLRYVPHFDEIKGEPTQLTDDSESEEPLQAKGFEEVVADYIDYADFGHNPARTWDNVTHVWRKVYLDRKESMERFPDFAERFQYSSDYNGKDQSKNPASSNDDQSKFGKVCIYEVWCKTNRIVYWLTDGIDEFIDEKEDPLQLSDFFPCPRPLYGIISNNSLIPVPDYTQIQDQAQELDSITRRIAIVTSAVKVIGVYDGSVEGLQRALSEGYDNRLVKVDNWAMMAEKGGLEGSFALFPMKEIVETLIALYAARKEVLNTIYEVSGMSDIMRGATDPDETATAQQIKGQYASLRLKDIQQEIARYSRDCVVIISQIIATHFSIDTIKKLSNIRLLTTQEKMQLQQREAMRMRVSQMPPNPQMPAPPQIPPITEEEEELLEKPTWEEVEALFRDKAGLSFKVDIETDSTIRQDLEEDRKARVEFLSAVSEFLQQSAQIASPELTPLLGQMLLFGVRGFNVSKDIETAFEVAVKKLDKKAQQPPPPNPEMQKMQMEMQLKQQELQLKQQEAQQQMQIRQQEQQADAAFEARRMQFEQELEQRKMLTESSRENDKMIMEHEREKQKMLFAAQMEREISLLQLAIEAQKVKEEGEEGEGNEKQSAQLTAALKPLQEVIKQMTDNYSRPKRVSTWRDKDGNLQGDVKPVTEAA